MVDEPTRVIASNVADNAPYTKTRKDERFVSTRQENIVLDSMDDYIVIDEMEVGELQSVRIVVDNPYVQVLLQLDEYRNKDPDGESPAEIIYNGGTDTANRGFKVIDGQGSGKGYVMEYRPDTPEEYKNRVRLVIRNQIKPNPAVYGMDLSYTSRGSLANPAVPAHMAGGTFSHPALRSAKLDQIAQLMTKPVGVEGYSSNQVFNEAIVFSENPVGSDHPYQGIAGKPTFHKDVSCDAIMESALVIHQAAVPPNAGGAASMSSVAYYRLQVTDEPDDFPGSSDSPSNMAIKIRPEIQALPFGSSISKHAFGFMVTPWYTGSTIRKSDLQSAGPFGDTWPGTSTYTPFTGTGADANAADGFDATEKSLTGEVLPAAESIIGKRFFFRRGGTVYFPGVVKSITKELAPMANAQENQGATRYSAESTISQTTGIGRFLDDANADLQSNTPSNYFAVGTHEQNVGNEKFIVMPRITPSANPAFANIVVGTNPQITLDSPLLLEPQYNAAGSAALAGSYSVLGVPHTPWMYTIEFEPGVTDTPIDFNTLFLEDEHNPYINGFSFQGAITTVYPSTGKYQNVNNNAQTGAEHSRGLFEASEQNCWGTVTSQADDNPHILIKEIEVKRTKKVSYDG